MIGRSTYQPVVLFLSQVLWAVLLCACQPPAPPQAQAPREVHTPAYDLIIPTEQRSLLILFPCFPCDAADTRSESPITDQSTATYL